MKGEKLVFKHKKKYFFVDELDKLSSILMLLTSVLAILFINSSLEGYYKSFINYSPILNFVSLKEFVQDILMIIFFLNISMELKREFHEGILADFKHIILPFMAALGGMIVPSLIYIYINWDIDSNLIGFAIPCATDIAFAIAVFNLISKFFPPSIKIFLLAIAIFDDLGAIILIALFYNKSISWIYILFLLLSILLLFIISKKQVKIFTPYIICGILLCTFLHKAGIHTTMAGVILGLFIPFRVGKYSPLKSLAKIIHPWVSIFILPLFTFTTSAICFSDLSFNALFSPLGLGVFVGLFLGKQIGIFLFSWITIKIKLSRIPIKSNLFDIYIVSILGGIGFTMSLFIGELAFSNPVIQNLIKTGLILGSLAAAIWGILIFHIVYFLKKTILIYNK